MDLFNIIVLKEHVGIPYLHFLAPHRLHTLIISWLLSSSETQGQIVGPNTKIKTGGKKFDDAPYWAENFSAQSGASIRSAVWNWGLKSLSLGTRIFLSYFCSSNFFPPVLIFVFGPSICPRVFEYGLLLICYKICTYSSLSSWLLSKIPRGRLLSWFSLNFL